jgi:MFS family permease
VAVGVLRIADFRQLWLAQTVSLVGTQITLLAFPLLALTLLDASPLEVSLLAAVEFMPVLLLGLPAGAWVDRLPRRPVLIATDVARALGLLSIPIAYAAGLLHMTLLYVVAFVVGVGTLFFDVAQLSYLPSLVEEDRLVDANAKLEVSRSVSQLAGPSLGGFVVAALTAPVAIAVDAVSYLVSTVCLLFIRRRETPPEPVEGVGLRGEIAEGFRFVLSHPVIRPLVLCAAAAELAFAAVLALQVVYAVDELHLGAVAVGIALAVGNAGGLVGAAICGRLTDRVGPGPAIVWSTALFVVGAAVLPLAGGLVGFAAGLFLIYVGVVVFNIVQVTLCQTLTPSSLLGRMNATLRFVTWGMVPVGAALGGVLVQPLGLRGVLWAATAVLAIALLPALLSPVRSLNHYPSAVDPGSDATPERAHA